MKQFELTPDEVQMQEQIMATAVQVAFYKASGASFLRPTNRSGCAVARMLALQVPSTLFLLSWIPCAA